MSGAGEPRVSHGGGEADRFVDHALGRRGLLTAGGVLFTGAALHATGMGRDILEALLDPVSARATNLRRAGALLVERLRREEDQLSLDVVLVDLQLRQAGEGSVLVASGEKGYLGFVLPGQSLGESVSHASSVGASTPLTAAQLAAPTLLAFEVRSGEEVPYDLNSLLDWSGWDPVWKSGTPGHQSSVIEAPFRMSMRPRDGLVWQHATEPQVLPAKGASTTELWHTRLTALGQGGVPDERVPRRSVTFEKTWATSLDLPLTKGDRATIVEQSKSGSKNPAARVVSANAVMLSPLGASLDLHGRWPDANNLVAWDHRAVWSRDDYVKTVYVGWLAPWGHPATVVDETVRRMRTVGGTPEAVLERLVTIVITEPDVDTSVAFARKSGGKVQGSRLPFTKVRALLRQSPPLRSAELLKKEGGIPRLLGGGGTLRVPFVGTDWAGNEVWFTTEVRFVAGKKPSKTGATAYNKDDQQDRSVDFGGQPTAISPETNEPGSTTLPLGGSTLAVEWIDYETLAGRVRAPFRPVLTALNAQVPSVAALAGTSEPVPHTYSSGYAKNETNPGGVVLKATPADAAVPGSLTGGLAQVASTYQGFSATSGAIIASGAAAVSDAEKGLGSASNIYDKVMLLGQLPLAKIVNSGTKALPTAVTEVLDGRQTVTLHAKPPLSPWSNKVVAFAPGSLELTTVIASGGSGPAEQSLDVVLTGCTLTLGGVVALPLDRFRVTSSSSAPFDVELTLGHLRFLGKLSFVQSLADTLKPFLGSAAAAPVTTYFAAGSAPGRSLARANQLSAVHSPESIDPPTVDVDTQGLHVGWGIALPDVQAGAFTMSGLQFGLGITLGFDGSLLTRVAFASYEAPFQLTYGCFGGGGYCALELTGGSVSKLEVSLMVAGAFGLNLGVAAGAVNVQAGFALSLPADGPVAFTAFFRAVGRLSVLGLISVTAVFELSLEYVDSDPSALTGTATLSVKVEVLFVSKTVSMSVTRTIAGSHKSSALAGDAHARQALAAGAPAGAITFRDSYPTSDAWAPYALAFA